MSSDSLKVGSIKVAMPILAGAFHTPRIVSFWV